MQITIQLLVTLTDHHIKLQVLQVILSGDAFSPANGVLRSTPVSRAISRWLVPVASSVATVVRLFGFKTFTLRAPFDGRRGRVTSCQRDCSPWASRLKAALGGQEVGDFARPTGGVQIIS